MSNSQSIQELLELYRPGVDDLDDAQWSELRTALESEAQLHKRLQSRLNQDHTVRTAMHEVSLPAGLAARLLAAVAASPSPVAATPEPVVSVGAESEKTPEVALPPPRVTRRHLGLGLGAALALSAAALLVVSFMPTGDDTRTVSADELAHLAQDWDSRSELGDGDRWSRFTDAGGLESHPLDQYVRAQVTGWQKLGGSDERSLVVYELAGGRALLFVANTARNYEVNQTPYTPLVGLSAGRAAGAWQHDGRLYVLIYNERDDRFEDFVRVANFT